MARNFKHERLGTFSGNDFDPNGGTWILEGFAFEPLGCQCDLMVLTSDGSEPNEEQLNLLCRYAFPDADIWQQWGDFLAEEHNESMVPSIKRDYPDAELPEIGGTDDVWKFFTKLDLIEIDDYLEGGIEFVSDVTSFNVRIDFEEDEFTNCAMRG